MTYIDYMNQLWHSVSMETMSASEIALYALLVNECNQRFWEMPFPCSSVRICETLRISKQTLCNARTALTERGLIIYADGRSRHIPSKYILLELTDDLSKGLTDGITLSLTDKWSQELAVLKKKEKENQINKDFSETQKKINRKLAKDAKSDKNQCGGAEKPDSATSSYEGSF